LVGAGVAVPEGATVIDCAGKHITPGIIDCHSHTGISRGVNEGGQAVTAEVRIQDVTNPDTTNWYWQLAGGVTAVLSLHGSANAIGGQSQTNKVRWGVSHPDQMHMEGAIPGIKFALGENPRRANSAGFQREGGAGAGGGARYPATRMGVEMLIRDRFTAAREYAASRARGEKVRRDLELEALAEILAGERLVHCHSYRQDEILMLANVSREFGFRIGTFQHILEGYKVADHVRDTSGGGSGFSDWWAYKMEVQDAIPGGLPLMHDAGCVVSFNSDSDELARRLNVEAGKAVKYGGLAEEEALKFVTLNPARQLKIDGRVGTLEAGRDADVVVWSGPPMSTFTKAERTFVDGRELFSLERDAASRGAIAAERARLVQKLLAERRSSGGGDGEAGRSEGGPSAGGVGRRRRPPTDDEAAALRRWYEDLIFRGKTPNEPGVCGCGLEHEW
jgi:imidazolonepropionase-like amidohydrolase